MKRLKALSWLAIFMVAGYAYHTATNVTENDVAAYHQFEQRTGWFRAFPGDVVAIPPGRSTVEPICSVTVEADFVDVVDLEQTYVNSLGAVLPRFEDAWAFVIGIINDTAEPEPDIIDFSGQLRWLTADGQPDLPQSSGLTRSFTPYSCECAMARRLVQGHRVCTVSGALVKGRNGAVAAIQFKTYSNFVNPEQFAKCGLDYSRELAERVRELSSQPCNSPNLPWDAVWRNRLGLIEAQPKQPGEAPQGTELHLSGGAKRHAGRAAGL